MKNQIERRRETRMSVSWPVVLKTSQGAFNGKMINISAGGSALICFSGPVEIDGEFSIIFNPSEDHEIYVPCEKIWSDKIIHEESVFNSLGVRFIEISSSDREIIASMVKGYYPS